MQQASTSPSYNMSLAAGATGKGRSLPFLAKKMLCSKICPRTLADPRSVSSQERVLPLKCGRSRAAVQRLQARPRRSAAIDSDTSDEPSWLLRPAGGGIYLVSTGLQAQQDLQRRYYEAQTDADVTQRFLATLEEVSHARVILLGVPSDTGAGFRRGANLGPQAIRAALIAGDPGLRGFYEKAGIIDIGDVAVVPQLLHDSMLAPQQIEASRAALYKDTPPALAATLPVSPLSIEARVLDCVFQLNPKVVPIILGGDHSVAWPVSEMLAKHRSDRWGIVQPDAHTDLLAERLGITYCYA